VDGAAVDVESVSMALASPEGPAVQTIVRDISERKNVERMKDEFISIVSHELRTPLTSMRGSLGLLAGKYLSGADAAARDLAAIALRNTDRLLKLVNQILDLSKLEQGRMQFDLKPQAVLPLVEQALEANRGFGEAFGVRFRLEEPREDGVAAVDADRIQQVLANLLSNAVKYSVKGHDVKVFVRRARGRVEIAVSNQGLGIPEGFRDRIFEKFQMADSSDSRRIDGTGLGLAISKSIVEAHGGRIGFEIGGDTTTFHFDLPLARGGSGAVPGPRAATATEASI
jgi:signal transduction histidine kinase